MNRLRWLAILMGVVILAITGFQVYWLRDNYRREAATLQSRTDGLFRETVRSMQDSVLQIKIQNILVDSAKSVGKVSVKRGKEMGRFINVLSQTLRIDSLKERGGKNVFVRVSENTSKDSAGKFLTTDDINPNDIKEVVVVNARGSHRPAIILDSLHKKNLTIEQPATVANTIRLKDSNRRAQTTQINTIYISNLNGNRVSVKLDSLVNDSLPLQHLEQIFAGILKKEKLDVPFSVVAQSIDSAGATEDRVSLNIFRKTTGYKLVLDKTYPYLFKRISWPILFSFFLVGITVLSFILLYRSLLRQHRLAQLKNDLISNITHELKTPIATVGVAIEALKNFNAINDPARTKEYLAISQGELQRLALLVDKVLKLSMFENKKIAIKQEVFDLNEVVNEVVTSLRLQADKIQARITVTGEGDMTVRGDRLHLLSVVFNLLDNAMKYSKTNAAIAVETKSTADEVVLSITDNGIGIAPAYREKIFEKFFRVPTGDTHNAKGHGLGLSYVAQVVRQHGGTIEVSSQEGIGSIFTITLPKKGT